MKIKLWFLGIMILAVGLRLLVLANRGSLWFDEAFVAHFSSMDLSRMLSYLRFENNPPLYFVIMHFWIQWFGQSETVLRLFSLLCGMGSIGLLYGIGARFFSRKVGLFAAFLTALSPFQSFYAVETRMYAFFSFAVLVVMYYFFVLICGAPGKRWHVAGFTLAMIVMLWVHITGVLVVGVLVLFVAWRWYPYLSRGAGHPLPRGEGRVRVLIPLAMAAATLLPWFARFFMMKIAEPLSHGWFFFIPPRTNFFPEMLEIFLVFGERNAFIVTLLSLVLIVLGIGIYRTMKESPTMRSRVVLLFIWLLFPLFVGFAFQNSVPRYFTAAAPALYLLLGVGYERIASTRVRLVSWALPLLCFGLILASYPTLFSVSHHEWDKIAGFVTKNEECRMKNEECKSLILIHPHSEILPFERYYHGNLPVIGVYPEQDSNDRDMRIVKTNWISVVSKQNIPWLEDVTAPYTKVFLITGDTDQTRARNLVPEWFWSEGWRSAEFKEFGAVSVRVLERIERLVK